MAKYNTFEVGQKVNCDEHKDRFYNVIQVNETDGELLLFGHFTEDCTGPMIQKWKPMVICSPLPKQDEDNLKLQGQLHATVRCASTQKPPLGIQPRKIWDETRLYALSSTIHDHLGTLEPIKQEWIDEYNEIVARRKQCGDMLY